MAPELKRLNTQINPTFVKGVVTGLSLTVGYNYKGKDFVIEDYYELPEEDQMYAEELTGERMGVEVDKGIDALNLTMRVLQMVFDYKMENEPQDA
jgi:hypothetical protein